VSHGGGDPSGDFIQTLDMTDICTGWTETEAVKNKAWSAPLKLDTLEPKLIHTMGPT